MLDIFELLHKFNPVYFFINIYATHFIINLPFFWARRVNLFWSSDKASDFLWATKLRRNSIEANKFRNRWNWAISVNGMWKGKIHFKIKDYEMNISSKSCHGDHVHGNANYARSAHNEFRVEALHWVAYRANKLRTWSPKVANHKKKGSSYLTTAVLWAFGAHPNYYFLELNNPTKLLLLNSRIC